MALLDRAWFSTLVDDDGSGLTGSVWDKADVDALMDTVDAEVNRPTVMLATATGAHQSIGSGAPWTQIIWTQAEIDPFGMWSASAPANITIPQTGVYIVLPMATFLVNGQSSGHCDMVITNASAQWYVFPTYVKASNDTNTVVHLSLMFYWAVGTVVQVNVTQNTPTAMSLGQCRLGVARVC